MYYNVYTNGSIQQKQFSNSLTLYIQFQKHCFNMKFENQFILLIQITVLTSYIKSYSCHVSHADDRTNFEHQNHRGQPSVWQN